MSFSFGNSNTTGFNFGGNKTNAFDDNRNNTTGFNFGCNRTNCVDDEFDFENQFQFNNSKEDVDETMLETADDFKKRIEKNKDNFFNKIKQQLIKNYDTNKTNTSDIVTVWFWSTSHSYGYSDDDTKLAFDIAKKLFGERGFGVKLEYWGSNQCTFDKSKLGWGENKWKSFNSKIRIQIKPKN